MEKATLFEYYMVEEEMLTEEAVLLEGKILDAIKKVAGTLNNYIQGLGNQESTQLITQVVKNKLGEIQNSPQTSPQNKQVITRMLEKLPEVLKYRQVINIPKEDLSRIGERAMSPLNRRMMDIFGSMWEEHMVTQEDLQNAVQSFQQEHGNVAMPVQPSRMGKIY